MNIKYNVKQGMLIAFSVATACTFTACKDQPDEYEVAGGTPTVNYIRSLSTEVTSSQDAADMHYTTGELVTEASPRTVLALVGDNLRSVYKIFFNDCEAILNTSYITDNALIVSVPSSVPKSVSDQIYLITEANDTVTVDFHIVIPAPQATTMSCEYASVGDEVTLTGGYFIDDPNTPLEVEFRGLDGSVIKVPHSDMTFDKENFTTLTFHIPEGATEGPIAITSLYGESVTPYYYQDTRGMLFDFDADDALVQQGWHAAAVESDETSLSGNFMRLGTGSATLDGATWDDSNFAFQYWAGSWDTPQNITSGQGMALFNKADFTNPDSKALKFEMYIPETSPWSSDAMQITFAGLDKISLSGNPVDGYDKVGGASNALWNDDDAELSGFGRAMYRPWTTTGSYSTGGKWVTVTVPLANFTFTYDGGAAEARPENVKDFASLTMFINGGGVSGTACTPIIKIDNIRVVPNK